MNGQVPALDGHPVLDKTGALVEYVGMPSM